MKMSKRLSKIIDKIKYAYWSIIPYDWRPGRLWYRVKCGLFHRYTTVKPRTLNFHTWCDRCTLLPHMMFEILVQFVEKELNNEDGSRKSEHTFIVGDKEVNVRDEIYDLYDWWTKDYLINANENGLYGEWHKLREAHCKDISKPVDVDGNEIPEDEAELFQWLTEWDSPEIEEEADRLFKTATESEARYEQELEDRMCRLVKIHRYLWT